MTNGWPERPGVPLNPERSSSHWVRDANCETVTADWNADVQKWAPWPFCPPEAFADDNDYLGPCLTPAEVAALVEAARRKSAAEEREACAEIVEDHHTREVNDIIRAIRARGAA